MKDPKRRLQPHLPAPGDSASTAAPRPRAVPAPVPPGGCDADLILERDRLRLLVRAAAVASHTEAEFVRRVRRAGVTIWLRSYRAPALGSRYALEARAGSGRTHLDTDLDADLTLMVLREDWANSMAAQGQAFGEWRGLRRPGFLDRELVVLTDRVMWVRMFEDAGAFNTYLRALAESDRPRWAWASGRLAGVLALWALRLQGNQQSRALKAAAWELARSAQIDVRPGRSPIAAPSKLNRVASGLAQLEVGVDGDPTRQTLLLLVQVIGAMVDIAKAHRRRGELTESITLTEATGPLTQWCRELHRRAGDGGLGDARV